MKRTFIATCLCAIVLLSLSTRAADSGHAPFQTVLVRSDTIIATLPASGTRWLVESGSPAQRVSEYGEAFTLRAGTSLRLTDKHSTYLFAAQLKSPRGLHVESTFDAKSFGGAITKKIYFIPAR